MVSTQSVLNFIFINLLVENFKQNVVAQAKVLPVEIPKPISDEKNITLFKFIDESQQNIKSTSRVRANRMFSMVGGCYFKCPDCTIPNFNTIQQAEAHYRKEHGSKVPPFHTFVDLSTNSSTTWYFTLVLSYLFF